MHEYLELHKMQIYSSLLLLTLNVPVQFGKCTPLGVHAPQIGNPCANWSEEGAKQSLTLQLGFYSFQLNLVC